MLSPTMPSIMYDYLGVYIGAYEGGKADATFSFTDEDFVKVALGKMNPQIAFMRFSISARVLRSLYFFFFSVLAFSVYPFTSLYLLWWCTNTGVRWRLREVWVLPKNLLRISSQSLPRCEQRCYHYRNLAKYITSKPEEYIYSLIR